MDFYEVYGKEAPHPDTWNKASDFRVSVYYQ